MVVLGNGAFAPCRKQGILAKTAKMTSLRPTHKNKAFWSSGSPKKRRFPEAYGACTPPPNDTPKSLPNSGACFRAARLQNETAPENALKRYEKWFGKREKGCERRSETCPKFFEPLSPRLKMSHWHFSKSFWPPKICTKKVLFSLQGSAGWPTATNFNFSINSVQQ